MKFFKHLIICIIIFTSFISCNKISIAKDNTIDQKENKPFIKIIGKEGIKVEFDLTSQVLSLDIPKIPERLYSKYSEEHIYPTLSDYKADINFVSTAMVLVKLKQFDDGLYAAIELMLQNGSKHFIGKKQLLEKIKNSIELKKENHTKEIDYINDAINLGIGKTVDLKDLEKKYDIKEDHLKPIGFYTWSNDLENIFKQDRLLQKELKENDIVNFNNVFIDNSNIKDEYINYTNFIQKFTNSFPSNYFNLIVDQNNIDIRNNKYFFFPPCKSLESELFKSKFSNSPPPDDYSLMEDVIEQIQTRKLNLKPKNKSGWYDHKQYSYEPFLIPDSLPEAQNLYYSEKYKTEVLKELFKFAMSLTRETHIKNIEIPMCGAVGPRSKTIYINIKPDLKFEPNMTFYKRSADSYRFIREELESFFDISELKKIKRYSPDIKITNNLYDELKQIEDLLYGIYYLTAQNVGYKVEYEHANPDLLVQKALEWNKNIKSDFDLGVDNRMMVPVFYNPITEKYKVWMFLGYNKKRIAIGYKTKPSYKTLNLKSGYKVVVKYMNEAHDLLYPIFEEIYVDSLLNREEFRKLCNKVKTVRNLKKYFGTGEVNFNTKTKNILSFFNLDKNDIYSGRINSINLNDSIIHLKNISETDSANCILDINTDNLFTDRMIFTNFNVYTSKGQFHTTVKFLNKSFKNIYKENHYFLIGTLNYDNKTKYYFGKISKITDKIIEIDLINNKEKIVFDIWTRKYKIKDSY